jgi:hypothetical protein
MRRVALLAVVCLALPGTVNAQARLMVGGGISIPSGDFADGDFADAVDAGKHGRVGLQVGVPVFPVSLRAEGEIHSFSEATAGDKANLINGTISAVLSLGGIGLSPYVIAGLGSYRFKTTEAEAVTNRGVHGGFGASIGALGLGGFAEVRLVNIDGDGRRYIVSTIGFRF